MKELVYIILASLVMGYVAKWPPSWGSWLLYALFAFFILAVNIIAKKLAAARLGCEIETKLWQIKRYWITERAYFRKAFPAWLVFPIFAIWLTLGKIKWLGLTIFDVRAAPSRVERKYAELTEWDIAVIAAAGITANILLALVFFLVGWKELALFDLLFVFFNMLPIPSFDGCKILFGDWLFFCFIFVFSLVLLFLAYLLPVAITFVLSFLFAVSAAVVLYALLRKFF